MAEAWEESDSLLGFSVPFIQNRSAERGLLRSRLWAGPGPAMPGPLTLLASLWSFQEGCSGGVSEDVVLGLRSRGTGLQG